MSDKIIHKSDGLTIILETWRGDGIEVFTFETKDTVLRVRHQDGDLSIVFNKGALEINNSEESPVALLLSKKRRSEGRT